MAWNLYHRISDAPSAAVRHAIVEKNLQDRIRFCNIGVGTNDLAHLKVLTGTDDVPVLELVDEARVLRGSAEILAFINAV